MTTRDGLSGWAADEEVVRFLRSTRTRQNRRAKLLDALLASAKELTPGALGDPSSGASPEGNDGEPGVTPAGSEEGE